MPEHVAPEPLIGSFAELLVARDLETPEDFEEWIVDEFEPYVSFCSIWSEEETEDGTFGVNLQHHEMGFDQATFALSFPCTMDDFYAEWSWLDDFYAAHSAAQELCYWPYATLGVPGGEQDETAALATWLGVEHSALLDALGGPWELVEESEQEFVDVEGCRVFGWFTRPDDPAIHLGVGGSALYVEHATADSDGTLIVPEDLRPVWFGPYYWRASDATREHEPQDVLAALRIRLT